MPCTYVPLLSLSAFVLKLDNFKIFNDTTRVLCLLVGNFRTCIFFYISVHTSKISDVAKSIYNKEYGFYMFIYCSNLCIDSFSLYSITS